MFDVLAQTSDPAVSLYEIIRDGGMVAFLLVVLLGGSREWWVFGSHFREMRKDRDEWRRLALKGAGVSALATDVSSKAVLKQPVNASAIDAVIELLSRHDEREP